MVGKAQNCKLDFSRLNSKLKVKEKMKINNSIIRTGVSELSAAENSFAVNETNNSAKAMNKEEDGV